VSVVILGFAERYSIEKRGGDVLLRMRQGARALRVGAVCAVVLFVTWWIGPGRAGIFYWLWSGFFACVLLASLFMAPFHRKDIIITNQEVVAETVFYGWKSSRRISRGTPLGVRIETVVNPEERPTYPFRLHFLDADSRVSGLYLDFDSRRGVDEMIDAVRTALDVSVQDPPGFAHARTGETGNKPASREPDQ
jgi:hypothetical protein